MRLQRTLPHGNAVLLSYRTVQRKPHVFIDSSRYRPKPYQSARILSLPCTLLGACQIGFASSSDKAFKVHIHKNLSEHDSGYQLYGFTSFLTFRTRMLQYIGAALYLAYSYSLYGCTATRAAFCLQRTRQNSSVSRLPQYTLFLKSVRHSRARMPLYAKAMLYLAYARTCDALAVHLLRPQSLLSTAFSRLLVLRHSLCWCATPGTRMLCYLGARYI